MGKNYFLTGATGFVGRYILKELLAEDCASRISLLVRDSGGISAHAKVEQMLRFMFSPAEYSEYVKRIQVHEGDISTAGFGLSPDIYQSLWETTNIIFHAAASIKFDLPLDQATWINVEGTHSVLRFAEKCMKNGALERMNHISTAYVTGKQKRFLNTPDQLEFANTYEQTKFNSEKLVGSYIDSGVPITIYRPSIISGHSVTGEITSSNIIYLFLLMFSRNMIPVFPCQTDSSLNIISINYFIEMMFLISKSSESIGKTYNLTNPTNSNMYELIEIVCKELGVRIPKYVPFGRTEFLHQKVREQVVPFINYIEQSHYFDLSETRKLLNTNFTDFDDIKTGLKKIIEYCCNNRLLRRKKHTLNTETVMTGDSLYL